MGTCTELEIQTLKIWIDHISWNLVYGRNEPKHSKNWGYMKINVKQGEGIYQHTRSLKKRFPSLEKQTIGDTGQSTIPSGRRKVPSSIEHTFADFEAYTDIYATWYDRLLLTHARLPFQSYRHSPHLPPSLLLHTSQRTNTLQQPWHSTTLGTTAWESTARPQGYGHPLTMRWSSKWRRPGQRSSGKLSAVVSDPHLCCTLEGWLLKKDKRVVRRCWTVDCSKLLEGYWVHRRAVDTAVQCNWNLDWRGWETEEYSKQYPSNQMWMMFKGKSSEVKAGAWNESVEGRRLTMDCILGSIDFRKEYTYLGSRFKIISKYTSRQLLWHWHFTTCCVCITTVFD